MRQWERAKHRRVAGALTSGLLVALLIVPSVSDADSHWILLEPREAPVGDSVKVSGNGFVAPSTVRVYFGSVGGPLLATTSTKNSQGRINTRILVPERPLGIYTIFACSIDPGTGSVHTGSCHRPAGDHRPADHHNYDRATDHHHSGAPGHDHDGASGDHHHSRGYDHNYPRRHNHHRGSVHNDHWSDSDHDVDDDNHDSGALAYYDPPAVSDRPSDRSTGAAWRR